MASNAIEITIDANDRANIDAWQPAGLDAPAGGGTGWVYTQQAYDWNGRPTVTTSPGPVATTREVMYGGCGCAGGAVVTTRDEVGRRQRVTYDVLGRAVKTQVLSILDKSLPLVEGTDEDVYSTVVMKYNARDQITEVTERAGVGGTPQLTTLEYDGHGRLSKHHLPQHDAGRFTAYVYNADDTAHTVTDARGARVTYEYNGRRLVTRADYDVSGVFSGQSVAETPDVTYGYDAVGNRLWMTDGLGRVDYAYDTLGRLRSESRAFNDLPARAPYTLAYDYTLAGALKGVTDPFNAAVTYKYDHAGRVTDVTGAGFRDAVTSQEITRYVSDIEYRAWGGLKHLTYTQTRATTVSTTSIDVGYNARQQVSEFTALNSTSNGLSIRVQDMRRSYTYYPDGGVRFVDDQLFNEYDRLYKYDHAGRMTRAMTSTAARADADEGYDGPFNQKFEYDVWGNTTSRHGSNWNRALDALPTTYLNNRDQMSWVRHDGSGTVTEDRYRRYAYDAAGRQVLVTERDGRPDSVQLVYDGDGQVGKSVQTVSDPDTGAVTTAAVYHVRSSVLGGRVVTVLGEQGQKQSTNVFLGGQLVATQHGETAGLVSWHYADPVVGSRRSYGDGAATEPDPAGVDAGLSVSSVYIPPDNPIPGNKDDLVGGCTMDGAYAPCSLVMKRVNAGATMLGTVTTVTIKRRSGKVESYSGNAGLPEGYGAHFTGFAAGMAASAFHLYREDGFGAAVFNALLWGRIASGVQTDGGGTGGGALFFAPQNTPQSQNNLTGDQRAIANSVQDGLALLSGNNRCSRFFRGSETASYVLRELGATLVQNGVSNEMDRPLLGITMTFNNPDRYYQNVGFRIPSTTSVNRSGPFFRVDLNRRVGGNPGYTFGSRGARLLQILHELAHAIRRPDGQDYLIPSDVGPNREDRSPENTRTVETECKDEIDFIIGR